MNNKLVIGHLFADRMNIYGDYGNVMALDYRASKRGIQVRYIKIDEMNIEQLNECNFILFGGGQDEDQVNTFSNIQRTNLKTILDQKLIDNIPALLICGGYQLLGEYFIDGHGREIKGLNLLPIITKSPDASVKSRCIGNIVIKHTLDITPNTLVGFENHGGQTFFTDPQSKPLGTVIKGFGNNLTEKKEGLILKNFIGTYMHGSLLPKNPHLTDWFISKALNQQLIDLDSTLELMGHMYIVDSK